MAPTRGGKVPHRYAGKPREVFVSLYSEAVKARRRRCRVALVLVIASTGLLLIPLLV
jgi:hypothetical protein